MNTVFRRDNDGTVRIRVRIAAPVADSIESQAQAQGDSVLDVINERLRRDPRRNK